MNLSSRPNTFRERPKPEGSSASLWSGRHSSGCYLAVYSATIEDRFRMPFRFPARKFPNRSSDYLIGAPSERHYRSVRWRVTRLLPTFEKARLAQRQFRFLRRSSFIRRVEDQSHGESSLERLTSSSSTPAASWAAGPPINADRFSLATFTHRFQ